MVNHPPGCLDFITAGTPDFWPLIRQAFPFESVVHPKKDSTFLLPNETGYWAYSLKKSTEDAKSPVAFKERINSPREKYKTSLEFFQITRTPVSLYKNLKRWYEKIRLKFMTKIIFICQTRLIDFWNQFYSFSNTVDQCSFVLRCFLWLELIF